MGKLLNLFPKSAKGAYESKRCLYFVMTAALMLLGAKMGLAEKYMDYFFYLGLALIGGQSLSDSFGKGKVEAMYDDED